MTQLLEEAVYTLKALPGDEQNRRAAWLLDELESKRKWDALFAESQDLLAGMADEAFKNGDLRGHPKTHD
ncbi:MAG: hypothetical protein IPK19_23470 [Chloroflexi bacterium]|nr:hypothetical protein [Chloroflexota bacterium]